MSISFVKLKELCKCLSLLVTTKSAEEGHRKERDEDEDEGARYYGGSHLPRVRPRKTRIQCYPNPYLRSIQQQKKIKK